MKDLAAPIAWRELNNSRPGSCSIGAGCALQNGRAWLKVRTFLPLGGHAMRAKPGILYQECLARKKGKGEPVSVRGYELQHGLINAVRRTIVVVEDD